MEVCGPDFALLPTCIITHVMNYLKVKDFKNASSVCKSWYQASTDSLVVKTITFTPQVNENASEICKTNRKYGKLKVRCSELDEIDSHNYFEIYKKFCPFVYELNISVNSSNPFMKIHHLLELLEHTTCLKSLKFSECPSFVDESSLFPSDYNNISKELIVQNLLGVKSLIFENFINYPIISGFMRCTPNLNMFRFCNQFIDKMDDTYKNFFTIFIGANIENITHFDLNLYITDFVDQFLTRFNNLKMPNLKSLKVSINWTWNGGYYKTHIFENFIFKLKNLEELNIGAMKQEQLTLICRNLVNLKDFNCYLWKKDHSISELTNLKKLEKLRCQFLPHYDDEVHESEMKKFFSTKFENLRILDFDALITDSNFKLLCENHPNLIELRLHGLLTRNIEPIFKYLTKLRIVYIIFKSDETGNFTPDSNVEYQYKISRLQDLEVFRLSEPINGISENDVQHLKRLRSTNLPKLFSEQQSKRLALNRN